MLTPHKTDNPCREHLKSTVASLPQPCLLPTPSERRTENDAERDREDNGS